MKSYNIYLTILIFITLAGCSEYKTTSDDYFTDLPCENVVGVKIHDFDSLSGQFFRVHTSKIYTVVMVALSPSAYEIMKNSEPNKFRQFVKIGRGPNEVIMGGLGCFVNDSIFCSMSMNGSQKLAFYNLNHVINGTTTEPYNEIDINGMGARNFSDYYLVNDSLIIGRNDGNDSFGLINTFNLKTLENNDYFKCPFLSDNVLSKGRNALFTGDFKINSKKNRFVFNSFRGDIITFGEITDSGVVKIVKNYELIAPKFADYYGLAHTLDTYCGSKFMTYKNNKFYVQYIGHTYRELREIAGNMNTAPKSNIILVFDENGNPLKKYILDKSCVFIFQYKDSIVSINEDNEGLSYYQYDI